MDVSTTCSQNRTVAKKVAACCKTMCRRKYIHSSSEWDVRA